MNYYPFHIGDYHSHTAHLDPIEDIAYRRMLDLYYLREGPLPAEIDAVAKLARMRDHTEAVHAVLQEFFLLTPDGWHHERCDDELSRMLDKQQKAKDAAARSVAARQARAQQTLSGRSADVELPTPTPTPTPTPKVKSKRSASAAPVTRPDDVDEKVWDDYLAIRKAKRAPLTETALQLIRNEAGKAGITLQDALETCCARGWQGFKAEWLERDRTTKSAISLVTPRPRESFKERDERLARKTYEEITGKPHPDNVRERQGEVIDITPTVPFLGGSR